jgi:hypothetical protein
MDWHGVEFVAIQNKTEINRQKGTAFENKLLRRVFWIMITEDITYGGNFCMLYR